MRRFFNSDAGAAVTGLLISFGFLLAVAFAFPPVHWFFKTVGGDWWRWWGLL